MNRWEENEARTINRPVAAPLDQIAQLLGIPLNQLVEAAEHVQPYQHAQGYPVWSVYQLDRHLHPDRYTRHTTGFPQRRRTPRRTPA